MQTTDEKFSVTPLELFFDLVFVFALLQVVAFMTEDLSWHGVLRGLLILGMLWWSWVSYAWLGNVVKADEGASRLAMFVAMAVMFVLALTIPEAFVDAPGGLPGPVVIAVAFFAFRAVHLLVFWTVARDDPGLRAQALHFTPPMLVATALLLLAAGTEGAIQTALWAAAGLAEYLGSLLGGARGWRLRSVGHFAERHGLILIIALGESLLSIGVGIAGLPMSWPIVAAAVLGLVLAGALWWAYFDESAVLAERAVADLPMNDRPHVARDAYSYLHLPMVAGVVLVALGLKQVLEYVGDTAEHALTDPLTGVGLAALVGGVVLYLLAHVAFKLRTAHVLNMPRAVVALALPALLAIGPWLPALVTLAVLAVVVAGLVGVETRRVAANRDRMIRHAHD